MEQVAVEWMMWGTAGARRAVPLPPKKPSDYTDSRVLWNSTSGKSSWVWARRQLPSAR